MKFYKKSYIIFSLILISLIYKSYQNEDKKQERIENTIKLILSSMKGEINKTMFTLEYHKYNITFNNLKILKPLVNNIRISKEKDINNDIYFKIKNIKIIFIADMNIKLFSNNEIITDKSVSIESFFDEIIFKNNNDFDIEFYSINNYISIKNNKMSDLSFFNAFNSRKNCIFHEDGKAPIKIDNLNLKLRDIFKNIFEERIKIIIEKSINLLSYDMILIFNNFTDYFEVKDCDYFAMVKITRIQTKINYINLNKIENIVKIYNIIIDGEIDIGGYFSIICDDEKEHVIYKRNEKKSFIEINSLKSCKKKYYFYADFENDIIKTINDFSMYLSQNSDYYYKHILEI